MKWVSQVNGPSAPAQSTLGFPGQQKEQEYKQQQQQQKREDQADLQQRHAEIIRILKAPAMDDGPELGAVESRITSIRLNVQVYSTSLQIITVCDQWHREVIDLNRRMRNSWTVVEKTSLISLLIRFEVVLLYLLHQLPVGSAYDPMARQDMNHTRVVQLFVSSGNFLAFDRAGKQS